MKSLTSWLITMFMVMFWAFRGILAYMTQSADSWAGFVVFNSTIEIALLFITILSFILIVRRNIIGGILYLVTYGYYFGGYLVSNAFPVLMNGGTMGIDILQNSMIAIIAVILALFAFFNILFEKIRKNKYTDSKTDWFFNNKETDRETDERADKNQYKFY